MEFSEKGPVDPMNGHFSPINGLESVNGIQFSLYRTPTNLMFAHRVPSLSLLRLEDDPQSRRLKLQKVR